MAFNEREFYRKQLEKQRELLSQESKTQKEKDINNLKYMLYGIQPYSKYWRWGMCSSLKRAIQLLEKVEDKGE